MFRCIHECLVKKTHSTRFDTTIYVVVNSNWANNLQNLLSALYTDIGQRPFERMAIAICIGRDKYDQQYDKNVPKLNDERKLTKDFLQSAVTYQFVVIVC